jgi:2-oxoglutarate dehydrogenase E1 component
LPHLKSVRWVQDEPRNMGPWPHYALNAWPALGHRVEPVTRPASSSPSVGTVKRHMEEQKALIDRAFEALPDRVDEAGY